MDTSNYPPIQQFRIWSPEEQKYYYSGGTPSMLSSFFSKTATLHTVHKMPYQRDTFLHDKNGKEIYEGDILKSQSSHLLTVYWGEQGFRIKWTDGSDELSDYLTDDDGDMSISLNKLTYMGVIGNIYENPELLTNK